LLRLKSIVRYLLPAKMLFWGADQHVGKPVPQFPDAGKMSIFKSNHASIEFFPCCCSFYFYQMATPK
jgi:hypothetical protein